MRSYGPAFLFIEDVIGAHLAAIEEFGGMPGLRDRNALESAIHQARVTSGGEYLHSFPLGMAAAYGFHVCQAHAFNDGNKRIAALSVVRFLGLNGYSLDAKQGEIAAVFLQIADGQTGKEEFEEWLSPRCSLRDFARP